MLVYQHRERRVSPAALMSELHRDAAAASRLVHASCDMLVDLLIRAGELESLAIDELCPESDDDVPLARPLRRVTLSAARALVASTVSDRDGAACALEELSSATAGPEVAALPPAGRYRTSEGYALYAVYPQAYAAAALRYHERARPARVCCIGIRSIGTSLSAVVAAALESRGVPTRSLTLRPRGAPYARLVQASERLARETVAHGNDHFAIVDEGPGISGSTVAAVADWLCRLGVADDRIALFASHPVDPAALASPAARATWARTRTYAADFDELDIPERLERRAGRAPHDETAPRVVEISGGAWRRHLLRGHPFPAVHPQHERRKYVVGRGVGRVPARGVRPQPGQRGGGDEPTMLRFAGLGRYGVSAYQRARSLADHGFTPPVHDYRDGFMRLSFVRGKAATTADVSAPLLDTIATYAAHLARHAQVEPEASAVALDEMLMHNAAEALDGDAVTALRTAMPALRAYMPAAAVAIDGRLLPHEWIATEDGRFVKVDAFDHHRDDFFPGPTDIAWDLAGASVEWGLSRSADRYLLEKYCRLSGDIGVRGRLPFFRLAYTAWRLGYVVLAAGTLGACADGRRFAALVPRYASRLRADLACWT